MKLTVDQANQVADYIEGQCYLGNIVDDIKGDEGFEQRFFLATPKFLQNDDTLPYCVIRFHPLQSPFYTHWHVYNNILEAYADNMEFPCRG